MFLNDITSYMAFAPILFFAGVGFVCFYITVLVFNLESRSAWAADRFDLAYKVVFSLTLILFIMRSFFGDFAGEGTRLNVRWELIIPAIVCGLANWLIPKIRDNDNTEF